MRRRELEYTLRSNLRTSEDSWAGILATIAGPRRRGDRIAEKVSALRMEISMNGDFVSIGGLSFPRRMVPHGVASLLWLRGCPERLRGHR